MEHADGGIDFATRREEMVENQIYSRGIRDENVLRAMREVPREEFVPSDLAEFAYEDTPLPIGNEQTISQPYIVAFMIERLELDPGDRVLDVGTGSGYGAAVLSRIVREVHTVERHASLAARAEERFARLGYDNIFVHLGDGSLGWEEYAPYDAIVVGASSPKIPEPLLRQLALGGRLLVPVGRTLRLQRLVRISRVDEDTYERENLEPVQFVPLVGEAGWAERSSGDGTDPEVDASASPAVPDLIHRACEPFFDIEEAELDGLLRRIGDARVVLLGEATHGTAEFYDMRARITRELIKRKGFTIVAVEADWPDAAWIDRYIRGEQEGEATERPFRRFPTWMWANAQVLELVEWLRRYNRRVDTEEQRVGFYGLDLYSLYASIDSVLQYLDDIDPEAARVARHRYGCLSPWEQDPATYGAAVLSGRYRQCEGEVISMLRHLLDRRMRYVMQDGQRFFDAVQNARLVQNAERYYRLMYYGSRASWNLRDQHMFDTLRTLMDFEGTGAKAVVWAHNSHLGNAAATEMRARGEHNVGQLCREHFGDYAYLVGFGTDHGTVAAASNWGGDMEVKQVRPAHPDSYERWCHEAGGDAFLLPLRAPTLPSVREALLPERLERAIGVIYRPETEVQSHYFYASLPRQFDEYIWFDETHAVTPLGPEVAEGMPETFPFGL